MRALSDLHRHLDGSLRPSTVRELAEARGLSVPADLPFVAGMGLDAALARFRFTLSLLQEPASVLRVASEICEDAAADGVRTLEIRFAPQLHLGASVQDIVDAALEGIDGRAGLILCGLYGEDPEQLDQLVRVGATRDGVVGLDLAGGPTLAQSFQLSDYERPFRRAADVGLGRTVHAGEGRPPEEIRIAIEVLGAQRIGHGTTLLEDLSVVQLVLERGVVIEACPTSNVHTAVIAAVADHPLKRWLDLGIRAAVCTDNTLFSSVTASQELERVRAIPGITEADLDRVCAVGALAAF